MNLKITRFIMCVLSAAILAAAFFMPYSTLKIYCIIGLLTALAVVGVKFLRCPECGAQLQLFGMTHCLRCGAELDWK